jgi:hypothetical protein
MGEEKDVEGVGIFGVMAGGTFFHIAPIGELGTP